MSEAQNEAEQRLLAFIDGEISTAQQSIVKAQNTIDYYMSLRKTIKEKEQPVLANPFQGIKLKFPTLPQNESISPAPTRADVRIVLEQADGLIDSQECALRIMQLASSKYNINDEAQVKFVKGKVSIALSQIADESQKTIRKFERVGFNNYYGYAKFFEGDTNIPKPEYLIKIGVPIAKQF